MTWVPPAQRVLLVEDDHQSADLTRRLIVRATAESIVDHATTLAEAERLFAAGVHDLAIIDVGLPDGCGLDLVTHRTIGDPDVPIIVLTGNDDRDVWGHAADIGASVVLSKGTLEVEQVAGAMEFVYEVAAGTRISRLTTSVAQRLGAVDGPDTQSVLDQLSAQLGVTHAGLQIWDDDGALVADHRTGDELINPSHTTPDASHSVTRSIHGWNLFLWVRSSARRWNRIEVALFGLCDAILASVLLQDRQREVDASERRYRAVADASDDSVMVVDDRGVITAANAAVTRETGIDPVGYRMDALAPTCAPLSIAVELLDRVRTTGQPAHAEDVPIRRAGSTLWYSGWAVPSADRSDGSAAQIVLRDTTARVMTESELSTLALTDPLTGLANRRLAADRLQHALDQVGRRNGYVAVAQLDIDHFKSINDLYGHAAGDGVLLVLAERLQNLVRTADTSARLGGDEFLMIAEGIRDEATAEHLVDRMLEELCRPVTLDDRTIEVGVSIGYTLIDEPGIDASEALRQADAATYEAKHGGRRRAVRYEEAGRIFVTGAETSRELRRAFEHDRFVFRYQPIMRDGRLVSAEALVRIDHPEYGEISPIEFIDALVDSPLVIPTGNLFISHVLDQVRKFRRDGVICDNFSIHVNVAPQQLSDPQFVDHVLNQLAENDLPPTMLTVEITEQALVDLTRRSSGLKRLAEIGVGVYLDDFGTGSSSITHLRSSALTGLKVDRSFVCDVSDPRDGEIVEGLIALGHSLGMTIVVEGVETLDQLERFSGDDTAIQGFVYAPPLRPCEFAEWVTAHTGANDVASPASPTRA